MSNKSQLDVGQRLTKCRTKVNWMSAKSRQDVNQSQLQQLAITTADDAMANNATDDVVRRP